MASADFCVFSTALRLWLRLSARSAQTSPGTTRFFPSIYLPHLPHAIPCSYWASTCFAALPSHIAFYVVSVRQARGLPVVSLSPTSGFLQIPPHDGHPCLRLSPSRHRADSGLSPFRKRAPPGAQNKPCSLVGRARYLKAYRLIRDSVYHASL